MKRNFANRHKTYREKEKKIGFRNTANIFQGSEGGRGAGRGQRGRAPSGRLRSGNINKYFVKC